MAQRVQIGIVAGLALAALMGLLVYGILTREPLTGQSGSQRPGKPAPALALRTFEGQEVRLADFQGRPVVVNFWASWCAPCRVEMPHLIEAYRRHRQEGVVFIGVNVQDTRQNAEEFLREFDVPEGYLILADTTGQATVDYGVAGLPVTFFIDRMGTVRKRWVGALDTAVLEEQIGVISADKAAYLPRTAGLP